MSSGPLDRKLGVQADGGSRGEAAPAAPTQKVTVETRPSSTRAPQAGDFGDPTTLILVRHGRTAFTEQKRFSGAGGEDPLLSEAGLDDVARAARAVGRLGGPQSPFPDIDRPALVVTSPIGRCRQTGGAIAERCGVPVTAADDWAEIAFGIWDGLTYGEIAQRWPEDIMRWRGSLDYAPDGAETVLAFQDRMARALKDTLTTHQGRTLVVATHTMPVRAVVARALDAGPRALWRMRIVPASITVVRYWGGLDEVEHGTGGVEVLTVNATDHLL